MNKTYLTAASGLTLALALMAPVSGAEPQSPAQPPGPEKSQVDIGNAGRDALLGAGKSGPGAGQAKDEGAPGGMVMTATKRVEDLTGAKVVNQAGDAIGRIKTIVQKKGSDELDAVVSAGGFLGLGGKDVIVPLASLTVRGDELVSLITATTEELKFRPAYEKALYEEAPGERIVHLSAGGGTAPGTDMQGNAPAGASFSGLDKDRDGYLTKADVLAQPELVVHWEQVDTNRDQRIDRAEFSAFEVRGSTDMPAQEEAKPGEGPMGKEEPDPRGAKPEGGGSGSGAY
jgi:hypothetical protein